MTGIGHWVRRLLGAETPPAAPSGAPWSQEDRENWKRFMDSATGRRLIARGYARHYQNLIAAGKDFIHPGNMVHAGRGWGECLQWLQTLCVSCDEQQENDINASQGEAQVDEWDYTSRNSP